MYSKCLELNRRKGAEELGKKEWKILQKILGPKKYGEELRKINSNELYENTERFSETITKLMTKFYGHVIRMLSESRMINKENI